LLTDNDAVVRDLAAPRVRSSGAFPRSSASRAAIMLDPHAAQAQGHAQGITHRSAVNESVAASRVLGGAPLSGHGTCMPTSVAGTSVAIDTPAPPGTIDELRSPSLLIQASPASTHSRNDSRAALTELVRLLHLDAGARDGSHDMTPVLGLMKCRDRILVRERGGPFVEREPRGAGGETPPLPDDVLETQLPSAGLHVAIAFRDDPGLAAAVACSASRRGPRALIGYGGTRKEGANG
jgi:hypothetical protein